MVEHAGRDLPSEVHWQLVAATGNTLISIALLMHTFQLSPKYQHTHQVAGRVMPMSAALILLLGFSSLDTTPLLITAILLLLAPVFFAFLFWIEMLDQA